MKKIINFMVIVLVLVIASGCEDFLDVTNYTSKDENSFPSNEKDANQLLVGVYSVLNVSHAQGINTYLLISELASDDRFGSGGNNDKSAQAIGHLLYADVNQFNGFWADRYQGISRAISTIAALQNMPEGQVKNQKIGEAKFLRAHWYFELVQTLGDIPLLKELPTDVSEAKESPQQVSQEEIFQLIATDLWDAYSTMPSFRFGTADYPVSGTVTKWAAASLLARVYLFYTGFYQKTELPTETGSITQALVVGALEDVINNSGHDLLPDFRSLWPYSNSVSKKDYPFVQDAPDWVEGNKNKEVIFAIKMNSLGDWGTTVGYSNSNALFFGIRTAGNYDLKNVFPFGQGWGFGTVNPKMWDKWPSNDPRRRASIGTRDLDATGSWDWGLDSWVEETGMWQKKIIATTAYGKGGNQNQLYNSFWSDPAYGNRSDDDFQLGHGADLIQIRFADVLLMHSELTKSVDGINKVRRRASASAKNPANLADLGAYSLEALQEERRWELAFEGLRWGDIRRWRIAADVLDEMYDAPIHNMGIATTMKRQKGGAKARYEATKGFFNKPEIQLNLSNGRLEQNTGWTTAASYDGWVD